MKEEELLVGVQVLGPRSQGNRALERSRVATGRLHQQVEAWMWMSSGWCWS